VSQTSQSRCKVSRREVTSATTAAAWLAGAPAFSLSQHNPVHLVMKKSALIALIGVFGVATQALAQQKTVTGKVTSEQGAPLPGVTVVIKGTTTGTLTTAGGDYSIRAGVGQTLQFRTIGTAPEERIVGAADVINVALRRVAANLDAIVVTALGESAEKRALGTAQQTVDGAAIAETQRENFMNALAGRIAGVEVTSSSGIPGASTTITIRGVSSISSSNQPLFIIDGLPMDNKTLNTGVLASDAPGSATAFSNRGVDFSSRASDLNPEDIETLVVLKGPEASALYGIDAANGAIVITTKRGKAGVGGFEYSNNFRIESTRAVPEVQRVYGQTTVGGALSYFGAPYPSGTTFYNNVSAFFRTAVTKKHNLSFSGGAADNKINYRVSTSLTNQPGVVRGSNYDRINLTGSTRAQVNSWLATDLSMGYTYVDNNQPYKGDGSSLMGLLLWPATDNASDYITPAGIRRRITNLSATGEIDNPYFSTEKNTINAKNNHIIANFGLVLTPFSWGNLRSNIGTDSYTNENQLVRHPESAAGFSQNGIIDVANDITRSVNAQTLLNFNNRKLNSSISVRGTLGNAISDYRSKVEAMVGRDFLDPGFVSVNNTVARSNRSTTSQRRLVSLFGSGTVDYKNWLFVTLTGRNDWTSTIPRGENAFFYPSVSGSFIFSDAIPAIGRHMTGKFRAAYAEVGKDARPYAYRPSLEFKTTSNGGYGYGFTGPNVNLKPEFARSYEIGTELGFLNGRLGIDATVYRKQTKDQIVNDIRGSYGTGFILFNLNGAVTRNQGLELTVRGTPIDGRTFSWDVEGNFESARGKVLALPNALPESYVSDTWLFGNVRNGTKPGMSTRSLTGFFYLRDTVPGRNAILIDPTTGLPLRAATFIDGGYDRQPDYTIGIQNRLAFRKLSFSFLVDIRKGGDVFNATEQYLTARGLSLRTLDRDQPRVIDGVLRDGKENTANPTKNTIVVIPAVQTNYYTAISEELFIERDINWFRLRDVTARYPLPARFGKNANVFVTMTDLYLRTNYSGLDPIVNGNTAAVGGSGAAGIDYGNFPMPRGISFGIKTSF
jgi:TonB-linked SusC/RagA family outer membrane protein